MTSHTKLQRSEESQLGTHMYQSPTSPSLTPADLCAIAEYLLVAQQDIVRTANELRVQHPASPLIDRMMAHAGAAADLRARILGH